MDTLYKENIIEHYKHPKNYGLLADFDFHACVANSSCGDEIELWIKFEDEVVKYVKFEARGCAISTAAMSMLSERLIGMKLEKLKKIEEGEVLGLVKMEKSSGRIKCALLSLEAVEKAVDV